MKDQQMQTPPRSRILIVDDNSRLIENTKLLLQRERRYKYIHTSGDGTNALRILKKYKDIQIVITDICMPKLDGMSLTATIKNRWPHIEVIVMTGYISIETAVTAIKLGAYDYIKKPFDFSNLIHVLNKCEQKLEADGLIAQLSGSIFLSYAKEDVVKVENIYRKLRTAGFNPWIDTQNIVPGELWEQSIRKAIRKADFFFACISKNSIIKQGMIQKETKTALSVWEELLENDIYLIPIRLEDCPVPEPLKRFQWINLFEQDGWDKLFAGIRKGLKQKAKSRSTL